MFFEYPEKEYTKLLNYCNCIYLAKYLYPIFEIFIRINMLSTNFVYTIKHALEQKKKYQEYMKGSNFLPQFRKSAMCWLSRYRYLE